MATVNVTNLFLNENKRYREDVVVTLPAVLKSGGGRSQADPQYIQGGDALTAAVIEADTIVQKTYLIVDEAFPTGAVLDVDIAGTAMFTSADLTATGLVVSTGEDNYFAKKQTVTSTISGVTGDITTGKARIVLATEHPSLNNGQYAN